MGGYFGIKLGKDYLNIEPKLGEDSAKIHVYQPAKDISVAYEYNFDQSKNNITIRYNSNFPNKGKIKILNPWTDFMKCTKELNKKLEVLIDGKKTKFWLETKNHDSFIIFKSDFNHRTAEILLKE